MNNISWNNFQGTFMKQISKNLSNIWEKDINDKNTILRITKNKHVVIETIVDTNVVDEIIKYNWNAFKSIRQNPLSKSKYYVKCYSDITQTLHQMVIDLNNINKPDDDNEYSIDHINRDTLDNRLVNLRWATRSEQLMNADKRVRKYNAKELPEGISPEDIPKWVTYNKEVYNKETGATREFFRIEKHPTMKDWASSKSNKVSIQDKLAETYKKLEESGDPFEHPIMKFTYSGSEKPDYVKSYDKDPNVLKTDGDFVLKRDMIPKYVNFVKETDKRGCKFEIYIRSVTGQKRWSTSGSKKVSLENKYNAMISQYNTMQAVEFLH